MQNEDAPPTSNPEQTLPEKNEIILNFYTTSFLSRCLLY